MASGDVDDDEYVARLLKQDAMAAAKKYDLVGLDALDSKRTRPGAPKPNTSFLRHIIRQTDSHNAALRARETKESRARLRQLGTTEDSGDSRTGGRRHRREDEGHDQGKRKHRDRMHNEEEHDRRSGPRSRHEGARRRDRSRDRSRDTSRRQHPGHLDEETARSPRRRKRHSEQSSDDDKQRRRHAAHSSRKHERHAYGSRHEGRMRSSSPPCSRHGKSSRRHYRSRSPERASRRPVEHTSDGRTAHEPRESAGRSPCTEDESDPLEAIVGPLPPPEQPAVRSRGRGTQRGNSTGIDARFSCTYDPAMDMQPPSDDGDEWGDSVEAFRDRQRWKQQGAERLKAAGFSEEQVKKWEQGGERSEEDVRWRGRGQAREWDRGKVVDADGHIAFKADWQEGG